MWEDVILCDPQIKTVQGKPGESVLQDVQEAYWPIIARIIFIVLFVNGDHFRALPSRWNLGTGQNVIKKNMQVRGLYRRFGLEEVARDVVWAGAFPGLMESIALMMSASMNGSGCSHCWLPVPDPNGSYETEAN